MSLYEQFIRSISEMNFDEEQGSAVQAIVLNKLQNAIAQEIKALDNKISAPVDLENAEAKKLQEAYLKTIENQKQQLKEQQTKIEGLLTAQETPAPTTIPANFAQYFAKYFRNIKHVRHALEDAPPEIAKLQTDIISEVLSSLKDKKEKEEQIQELSSDDITKILQATIKKVKDTPAEAKKHHQLVQMMLFELIAREVKKLTEKTEINAQACSSFFEELNSKLQNITKDIGSSSIIDDFSKYKNIEGETPVQLLLKVIEKVTPSEKTFKDGPFLEAQKNLLQCTSKLRFGQDDRRALVKKIVKQMPDALFAARNLHENTIFTKNTALSLFFLQLMEHDELQADETIRKGKDYLLGIAKKPGAIDLNSKQLYKEGVIRLFEVAEAVKNNFKNQENKQVYLPLQASKDLLQNEPYKRIWSDIQKEHRTEVAQYDKLHNTYFSNLTSTANSKEANVAKNDAITQVHAFFLARTEFAKLPSDVQTTLRDASSREMILRNLEPYSIKPDEKAEIARLLTSDANQLKIMMDTHFKNSQTFSNIISKIKSETKTIPQEVISKINTKLQQQMAAEIKKELEQDSYDIRIGANGEVVFTLNYFDGTYEIPCSGEISTDIGNKLAAATMTDLAGALTIKVRGKTTEEVLDKINDQNVLHAEMCNYIRASEDVMKLLDPNKKIISDQGLIDAVRNYTPLQSQESAHKKTDNAKQNADHILRLMQERIKRIDSLKEKIQNNMQKAAADLQNKFQRIARNIGFNDSEERLFYQLLQLYQIYNDTGCPDALKEKFPLEAEFTALKTAFDKANDLNEEDDIQRLRNEVTDDDIADLLKTQANKNSKNEEDFLWFPQFPDYLEPQNFDELKKAYKNYFLSKTFNNLSVAEKDCLLNKKRKNLFADVLRAPNLEQNIKSAYTALAQIELANPTGVLKKGIQTAMAFASSAKEREDKTTKLFAAMKVVSSPQDEIKQQDANTAIKDVTEIFLQEFIEMESELHLGLADKDNSRKTQAQNKLKEEIKTTVKDVVTLMSRVSQGKPVFDSQEVADYFQAISTIAAELPGGYTMENVRFKITHGKDSVEIFDAEGNRIKIVKINAKLPYSIYKPVGAADFYLSFGGTRGINAPFEGLEEFYGVRQRILTSMLSLGVGQYGSVKELQNLMTGVNRALKKGFTKDAFKEEARSDQKLRPITSRADPLFALECSVLQALSEKEGDKTFSAKHWTETEKMRNIAKRLFAQQNPEAYYILMSLGEGESYADTARVAFSASSKGDAEYHNPLKRTATQPVGDIVALSRAIVEKAQYYHNLGFNHNDIKPENFLYSRKDDGSYEVKFIDWATGGFKQEYTGKTEGKNIASQLKQIFKEKFGVDGQFEVKDNKIHDLKGRFVDYADGKYTFGINPHLEITYGARNCTLPYICPDLVKNNNGSTATDLTATETKMDDWALTAMIFGICNRKSYFSLAKGRAVVDYTVPGIIEPDGKGGLKVINEPKFQAMFGCGGTDSGVMFIPGNSREGEPLHLYRRLDDIVKKLESQKQAGPEQTQLKEKITDILGNVRAKIASGIGFSKTELLGYANTKGWLETAQECVTQYEKLTKDLSSLANERLLTELIDSIKEGDRINALDIKIGDVSKLEILCTYPPATKEQRQKVVDILSKVIIPEEFGNRFNTSHPELIKKCIALGRAEVLSVLLGKLGQDFSKTTESIAQAKKSFIDLVKTQGLLHYALQEGMTETASEIIDALKRAGANDEAIYEIIIKTYGPKDNQPHIKWSTNAFHIAIRNGHLLQLQLLLENTPADKCQDDAFKKAIHTCAVYTNKNAFELMLAKHKMTAEEILNLRYSPENLSPYHLFLKNERTLDAVDTDAILEAKKAQEFLLGPASTASDLFAGSRNAFPLLIAAKHGNNAGVEKLLNLADSAKLSEVQWQQFLTQTDDDGKNILNHLLEHNNIKQFKQIVELCGKIAPTTKEGAREVKSALNTLLLNPDPVNPLKNFLQSTTLEDGLSVLTSAFDGLSLHYRDSNSQQENRSAIILHNKDWFYNQAKDASNHPKLGALLTSEALDIVHKQVVLQALVKAAPEQSNTFFTTLLDEVTPRLSQDNKKQIALEAPIVHAKVLLLEGDTRDAILLLATGQGSELYANYEKLQREMQTVSSELEKLKQKEQEQAEIQQKLQTELDTSQQGLSISKQSIASSADENKKLKDEIATLSQKLELTKMEAEDTKAQLAAALDRYKQTSEKSLASLKTYTDQKVRALEQAYSEKTQLTQQEKADFIVAVNAELKSAKTEYDKKLSELTAEKTSLQEELRALKDKLSGNEKNIEALKTEIVKAQKENRDLDKVNKQYLDQIGENNQVFQDEQKTLTEKIEKLNQQLGEKDADKDALTAQLDKLQAQQDSLQSQYATQAADFEAFKSDATAKQQEQQSQLETQLNDFETAKRENAELNKQLITLTREGLEKDKTKIVELTAQVEKQSSSILTTQGHLIAQKKEFDTNKKEFEEKVSALEGENKQLKQKLDEKQNQINVLDKALSDQKGKTKTAQTKAVEIIAKSSEQKIARTFFRLWQNKAAQNKMTRLEDALKAKEQLALDAITANAAIVDGLEVANKTIQALTAKGERDVTETKALQDALQEKNLAIQELEARLSMSVAGIDELTKNVEVFRQEFTASQQSMLATHQKENASLTAKINELTIEGGQNQEKIKALTDEKEVLDRMTREAMTLSDEKCELFLQHSKNVVDETLAQQALIVQGLQKEITDNKLTIANLEQQTRTTTSESAEQQTLITELQTANTELAKQLNDIRSKIRNETDSFTAAEKKAAKSIEELQAAATEAITRNKQLTEENASLKKQLGSLVAENESAIAELMQLQQVNEQLRKLSEKNNALVLAQSEQIRQTQTELEQAKKVNAKNQEDLAAAKRKYEEIRKSTVVLAALDKASRKSQATTPQSIKDIENDLVKLEEALKAAQEILKLIGDNPRQEGYATLAVDVVEFTRKIQGKKQSLIAAIERQLMALSRVSSGQDQPAAIDIIEKLKALLELRQKLENIQKRFPEPTSPQPAQVTPRADEKARQLLKTIDAEIETLTAQINAQKSEIAQLKDQTKSQQSENESSAANLNKTISEQKNEIEKLKEELKNTYRLQEHLQTVETELNGKNENLNKKITELQQKYESVIKENQEQSQKSDESYKRLKDDYEAQKDILKQQSLELTRQIQDNAKERRDSQEQIERLQSDHKDALEVLQTKVATTEDRLTTSRLQAEFQAQKKVVETLEKQITSIIAQIEDIDGKTLHGLQNTSGTPEAIIAQYQSYIALLSNKIEKLVELDGLFKQKKSVDGKSDARQEAYNNEKQKTSVTILGLHTALTGEISLLEQKSKELNEKITKLTAELTEQRGIHKESITLAESSAANRNKTISALEAKTKQTTDELREQLQNKTLELEKLQQTAEVKAAEQAKKIEEKEQKISDLMAAIEKLKISLDEALQVNDASLIASETANTARDAEKLALKTEIEKLKNELQALKTSQSAQAAKDTASQASSQQDLNSAKLKAADLERQLTANNAEMKGLKGTLKELQEKYDASEQEILELQTGLNDSVDMKSQIATLKAQLRELTAQNANIQRQYDSSFQLNKTLDEQNEIMAKKILELSSELPTEEEQRRVAEEQRKIVEEETLEKEKFRQAILHRGTIKTQANPEAQTPPASTSPQPPASTQPAPAPSTSTSTSTSTSQPPASKPAATTTTASSQTEPAPQPPASTQPAPPAQTTQPAPAPSTSQQQQTTPAQPSAPQPPKLFLPADTIKRNVAIFKEFAGEMLADTDLTALISATNGQNLDDAFVQKLNLKFRETLEFREEFLRAGLQERWDEMVNNLDKDDNYFKEISKEAQKLQSAKEQLIDRIKSETDIDTLMKIASTYNDTELETALRNNVYTEANFYALPRKLLQEKGSAQYRLTRSEYVRTMAENRLEELFKANRAKNARGLNPANVGAAPGQVKAFNEKRVKELAIANKEMFANMHKARAVLDKKEGFFGSGETFKDKVTRLISDSYVWLSPGYQASSRQNMQFFQGRLVALTREGEDMISILEKQRLLIKEQLESLPSDQELIAANAAPDLQQVVAEQRKLLYSEDTKINKDISIFEKLMEKMHGDGNASHPSDWRYGMLETMQHVKDNHSAIAPLELGVSYKDMSLDDANKFNSGNKAAATTITNTSALKVGAKRVAYEFVPPIEQGKVRVFELGEIQPPSPTQPAAGQTPPSPQPPKVYGRFMESYTAAKDPQLTVLKFPDASASHDEKVKVALAIACQLFAGLKHYPSQEHPIEISGNNAEELKYITTAIYTLGKKLEGFHANCMNVTSLAQGFGSNDEWKKTVGISGVFKDDFYSNFQKHPLVQKQFSDTKSLIGDKFISTKQTVRTGVKGKIEEDISSVKKTSAEFKQQIQDLKTDPAVAKVKGLARGS